jgi:hypothetical protein
VSAFVVFGFCGILSTIFVFGFFFFFFFFFISYLDLIEQRSTPVVDGAAEFEESARLGNVCDRRRGVCAERDWRAGRDEERVLALDDAGDLHNPRGNEPLLRVFAIVRCRAGRCAVCASIQQ